MITHPTIETLTDAVVAAAPKLDDVQRAIALATYREVATGRPASPAAIAERATSDVDADTVARQLDDWPGVFRDDDGQIVGFWGVAIPEMPHRLRHDGVDLHAWCAWDPLFLAHLIGDLDVETDDPVSGDTITYRITGAGTITERSHPESTVSFLVPTDEWGDDVLTTFCHYVLQFTDRASGERWTDDHPGTTLLTLDEAAEIGRRWADRVFGVDRP